MLQARKAAFGELQDRLIALPRPFLSQPTELVLWLHAKLSRCAVGPLSLKRSCLTAGCAEQLGTGQLGAENSLSSVSYLRYRHFFFHRCQYNKNQFSQPMRRMVEPEGWWNQLWRRVPRLAGLQRRRRRPRSAVGQRPPSLARHHDEALHHHRPHHESRRRGRPGGVRQSPRSARARRGARKRHRRRLERWAAAGPWWHCYVPR